MKKINNVLDYIKQQIESGEVKVISVDFKPSIESDSKEKKIAIRLNEPIEFTDQEGMLRQYNAGDYLLVNQYAKTNGILARNLDALYLKDDKSIVDIFTEAKEILKIEVPLKDLILNSKNLKIIEIDEKDLDKLKELLDKENISYSVAKKGDRIAIFIDRDDKERVESLITRNKILMREDKELNAEKEELKKDISKQIEEIKKDKKIIDKEKDPYLAYLIQKSHGIDAMTYDELVDFGKEVNSMPKAHVVDYDRIEDQKDNEIEDIQIAMGEDSGNRYDKSSIVDLDNKPTLMDRVNAAIAEDDRYQDDPYEERLPGSNNYYDD